MLFRLIHLFSLVVMTVLLAGCAGNSMAIEKDQWKTSRAPDDDSSYKEDDGTEQPSVYSHSYFERRR